MIAYRFLVVFYGVQFAKDARGVDQVSIDVKKPGQGRATEPFRRL